MSATLRHPIDGPALRLDIARAWQRRSALHDDPTLDAYRVFHGWQEGAPALEIDRYGDAAFITYRDRVEHRLDDAVAALDEVADLRLIVGKPRDGEPHTLRGVMPADPYPVLEHGLRYFIEPWRPRNPGLYLDARPARRWLLDNARDRRVLNLFAFTGSLGVAAAVGGAAKVVHVDSQRGALARCLANHALNGVPTDDRDLARVNIYQHLKRNAARRRRWDGIIIDPPPVAPSAAARARLGMPRLIPLLGATLAPGGWLLCFFHHSQRSVEDHEREVLDGAGVPLEVMWRGENGPDFPENRPERRLRLTAFRRA